DLRIDAFLKNGGDAPHVEPPMKLGASRTLHAVIRPEHLGDSVQVDHVAWFFPRVLRGEAAVIRRMPVLRPDDQIECALNPIRHGHDFVSASDSERAAWDEVILD